MLNKKSQPLIFKTIGFMYKKRYINFYSYVPDFFKYLVGDSSSPYSSANSAKCIYKKLFIFIDFLTQESPEKSGLSR